MKKLITSAAAIFAISSAFIMTGPSESEAGRTFTGNPKTHQMLVKKFSCYNMAQNFKDKPGFYYNVKYDAKYGGWTCFFGYKGHKWAKPL